MEENYQHSTNKNCILLNKLSDAQKHAVLHGTGAALVLAGPGSGKTTVITNRIVNLIISNRINPKRILTVTFSRAAATEMELRFMKLIEGFGGERERASFCTLHSYCNNILKQTYREKNKPYKVISGDKEKQKLIFDILHTMECKLNSEINSAFINEILCLISRKKTADMCDNEEKIHNLRSEIQIRNFDEIYNKYEYVKKEHGLVDFDDMLILAYNELSSDIAFAQRISDEYDFVQVDEGQDLSILQIEILKKIAMHGNIFMVADDDQGIYSFRGADTDGLRIFEKSFRSCKKYMLDENFRSVSNIVNISANVIKNNKKRYEKHLRSNNILNGKIKLYRAGDVYTQAKFIADIATKNANERKSTGILYRNNTSSLVPIAVLENNTNLSYTVSGGIINLRDSDIFKEFMTLREIPKKNGEFYKKYYSNCHSNSVINKDSVFSAEFLRALCRQHRDINKVKEAVWCYGEKSCVEKDISSEIFVHFSTVHSSKGLEYDEVIIIDTMENEFPPKGSCFGHLLEEERRLFYVGMTRARKALYVIYPVKLGESKCSAGIFYKELKTQIKLSKSQKKNGA